jgi:hypothetical protein
MEHSLLIGAEARAEDGDIAAVAGGKRDGWPE